MFRAEGLHKAYGGVKALDGATVEAALGSVNALLGENGAGKSTLSKILSGVVGADAGTVSLNGEALALGSPRAAAAAGVRTAFQELALVPDLTVAENLMLQGAPRNFLRHLPRRPARRRAREHLRRTGVDELTAIDVSAPVRELGLVQRHLLEVARALVSPPRILIMDEATSGLPERESQWALEKAREVAATGAVVLFITHRLNEVRAVADTLTVMRGGKTVAQGATGDFDDDALISAMLGRRIERLYPERPEHPGGDVLMQVEDLVVEPSLGPVSIDLRAGEILGLGGLEGQGQRAFLSALAGVLHGHGRVVLDGQPYRPSSPAAAIAQGVAFVPEDRQAEGLFLSHSIRSNVSISSLEKLSRLAGVIDRGREQSTVRAQIDRLNVPLVKLEHLAGSLSGGNQQKVVLSRVLLTEPKVVLLYDCTRGVDVGTKAEIYELLAELAAEGVAIVFYSSDISETVNLCDRVAVFVEGRIAATLGRERLSEDAILRVSVGSASQVKEVGV